MANDMMSTLKGLLGDNADEKIQSVLSALQNTSQTPQEETVETTVKTVEPAPKPAQSRPSGGGGTEGMEYLMKIKNIIDEMGSAGGDARSNLLLSLRPYMRKERQRGIDNAIRVLNLSKFSGLFKL